MKEVNQIFKFCMNSSIYLIMYKNWNQNTVNSLLKKFVDIYITNKLIKIQLFIHIKQYFLYLVEEFKLIFNKKMEKNQLIKN